MFPLLSKFPVLSRKLSPSAACGIGFLFGAIGLSIYFRSLLDLFAPLVFCVTLVLFHADPAVGWLAGALLSGAYGFFRAIDSNDRLAARVSEHTEAARG
jgi:hypothetical protein